jgi:hypothetical protein
LPTLEAIEVDDDKIGGTSLQGASDSEDPYDPK